MSKPSLPLSVCPFSVAVFIATALVTTDAVRRQREAKRAGELPRCRVVFVLGDPGSGKGTTCQLLQERLGWAHLSAGDLLRAERGRGGPLGQEINSYIDKGQLVPSEVTCRLLQQGMLEVFRATGKTCFVIDGFPRSFSNASVWEETMAAHKVEFILNLECPEEVLVGRLLDRGRTSGRADDTLDVIRKRFQTAREETKPILEHYRSLGKVKTIGSDKPVESVYQEVAALFVSTLFPWDVKVSAKKPV